MLLPIVLATVGDAGTLGNASFSRPLSTSGMFESVPSECTRHETKLHTDQVFLTGLRSRK